MGIVGNGHGGVVVRKFIKSFLADMFEDMDQRNACIKGEFSSLKRLRLYGGAQIQCFWDILYYCISGEVGVTMFLGKFV